MKFNFVVILALHCACENRQFCNVCIFKVVKREYFFVAFCLTSRQPPAVFRTVTFYCVIFVFPIKKCIFLTSNSLLESKKRMIWQEGYLFLLSKCTFKSGALRAGITSPGVDQRRRCNITQQLFVFVAGKSLHCTRYFT